jgi:hypothetical protein
MPLLEGLEAIAQMVKVAHTGFEPVISALRGRRPGPLDECASLSFWTLTIIAVFIAIVKGFSWSFSFLV